MVEPTFFGEYNNIYFVEEKGRITAIWDRAHRKRQVPFVEELIDLSRPRREPTKFFMEGPALSQPELGGNYAFAKEGKTVFPAGFGRSLMYHTAISESYNIAVALTIELPEMVRYQVRLDVMHVEDNRLALHEDIHLTVFTSLPWSVVNSQLVVQTGEVPGEITLLVESLTERVHIQETAIIALEGWEKEALLARAACGKGFVPSYIVSDSRVDGSGLKLLLEDPSALTLICLGLTNAQTLAEHSKRVIELRSRIQSSAQVLELLGSPSSKTSLIVPDLEEAWGPALLLALKHDANLIIGDVGEHDLRLVDNIGNCLQTWSLGDLIGVPLNFFSTNHQDTATGGELVICENTLKDLVVCQGIGYAEMQGLAIAFISRVGHHLPTDGFPDSETGIREMEKITRAAVPEVLRNPVAETLTVFTEALPLHLIKTETLARSQHWFQRYAIAHLPGQSASYLLRSFARAKSTGVTANVPFSIIFDALCETMNTEGHVYARELERGLSYPIVLPGTMAQRDLLRELIHRLDTDLILLITHGGGDSIIDGVGNAINSEEISHWKVRGTPIVFNNSCSSWTTTGNALLKAGARSLIATLWPVRNDVAASLASKMGSHLHDENEQRGVLEIFKNSVQDVARAQSDAAESLAAYVFVGPPRSQLRTQTIVGLEETLVLLTRVFNSLHDTFIDLAVNGRPDVALTAYRAVSSALRRRFESLNQKGELPRPLPTPFQAFTTLETDLIFANAAFKFYRVLLSHLPYEDHDTLLMRMDNELTAVVDQILSWQERHDSHLGRTQEQRLRESRESGMPVGAIGQGRLYRLMVELVYSDILPFVSMLTEVHDSERAKTWLGLATLMVTIPRDLSPDGRPSDEAVINRIREGNLETMRSYPSNEAVSIDHLEGVDRPDLLNRFGIAFKRLREYERALAFYVAARDLAEPGSKNYANAESNIANLRREQRGSDDKREALTALQSAFVEQEKLADYENAIVTAANMLRLSSLTKDVVDESIITRSLEWANMSQLSALRIRMCTDLLGAQACYYASRDKHAEAVEITKRIAEYLKDPFPPPDVEVHLNELVNWYSEAGLFSKSLDLALRNAAYFEDANLHEVAARTYIAAGAAAANAYRTTPKKHYVGTFLSCAGRVGAALQIYPSLRAAALEDFLANMRENLTSIWSQLANSGDRNLAVKAYESIKAWDPDRRDVEWELLRLAFNERNKEFIKHLADCGALSREAKVVISKDLKVAVETTTYREDKNSRLESEVAFADTVYSYLPLHTSSQPVKKTGSQMEFVAGAAVYPLKKHDAATVEERDVRVLRTDGQGTYFYNDMFGSPFISYRTVFALAPGFLPLALDFQSKSRVLPKATIRFGKNNCEIEIEAGDNQVEAANKVWMAHIDLVFREVPDDFLWGEASPFATKMPFEMYLAFLRMLRSARSQNN